MTNLLIRTTKQSHHNKVFEVGIKRGRERCLVDLRKTIKEIKDWRERCINCDCSQSEDYHKGLIDGYTLVIMELNELCKSPEQKDGGNMPTISERSSVFGEQTGEDSVVSPARDESPKERNGTALSKSSPVQNPKAEVVNNIFLHPLVGMNVLIGEDETEEQLTRVTAHTEGKKIVVNNVSVQKKCTCPKPIQIMKYAKNDKDIIKFCGRCGGAL